MESKCNYWTDSSSSRGVACSAFSLKLSNLVEHILCLRLQGFSVYFGTKWQHGETLFTVMDVFYLSLTIKKNNNNTEQPAFTVWKNEDSTSLCNCLHCMLLHKYKPYQVCVHATDYQEWLSNKESNSVSKRPGRGCQQAGTSTANTCSVDLSEHKTPQQYISSVRGSHLF